MESGIINAWPVFFLPAEILKFVAGAEIESYIWVAAVVFATYLCEINALVFFVNLSNLKKSDMSSVLVSFAVFFAFFFNRVYDLGRSLLFRYEPYL